MTRIEPPLVWHQAVVDKIFVKHKLTPEEVEESIFEDAPHDRRTRNGRHAVFGQDNSGRYVLTILRRVYKTRFRVITARAMEPDERAYYLRRVGRR